MVQVRVFSPCSSAQIDCMPQTERDAEVRGDGQVMERERSVHGHQ
jgi:hypothetical protein